MLDALQNGILIHVLQLIIFFFFIYFFNVETVLLLLQSTNNYITLTDATARCYSAPA